MTDRPTPPHGSEARYKGTTKRPPCRCRTCVTGWTRAGQKRLLGRLAGRPATIPAEPVTRHLNTLYAANMTPRQIAALSGVDLSTVRNHAAGEFPSIRRTTAEKLLAVQPGQQPSDGWVSSLGATRRCRALYTLGHGPQAITAAHPDLQLRTIEYVIRGNRQYVTVALHNTIHEAYRTLSQIPGTSTQARLRAAKEGWPGPGYWDDEDFDNPDFEPAIEATPRYIELAEDGLELEEHGHTREQAAARLGVTKVNLQAAISRYRKAFGEAA